MAKYENLNSIETHPVLEEDAALTPGRVSVSVGTQLTYATGPSILLTIEGDGHVMEVQLPVTVSQQLAKDFGKSANSIQTALQDPVLMSRVNR